MSMPVNTANHPTAPVAATQVVASPKEPNLPKSAMGVPATPVKHTIPDKSIQSSPALPAMHGQVESSPFRHDTPADFAIMPSPKPPSNIEMVKGDSTLKSNSILVSPTSATNANGKDAAGLKSDGATPEDEVKENSLTNEISELWSTQKGKSSSLRRSRVDLAKLRNKLAERLAEYHTLLARTGRDGKWMAFLKRADIPKSTAERLVKKWKLSKSPKPVSRATGTINAPSKEEIGQMVKKVKAKVEGLLTTGKSVALFITELAAALQTPSLLRQVK